MKLDVVEQSSDKLITFIDGADNTLLNILIKELQQHKHVVAAAFMQDHPLTARPKIIVQTDGKVSAKQALSETIKSIDKQFSTFASAFNKAFA